MTAVITAPTDSVELLAPVPQAQAPARTPAVGFEMLIALLQAQLAPTPTPATALAATPVGATAVPATLAGGPDSTTEGVASDTAVAGDTSTAPHAGAAMPITRRTPRAPVLEEPAIIAVHRQTPARAPEDEPEHRPIDPATASMGIALAMNAAPVVPVAAPVVAESLRPAADSRPTVAVEQPGLTGGLASALVDPDAATTTGPRAGAAVSLAGAPVPPASAPVPPGAAVPAANPMEAPGTTAAVGRTFADHLGPGASAVAPGAVASSTRTVTEPGAPAEVAPAAGPLAAAAPRPRSAPLMREAETLRIADGAATMPGVDADVAAGLGVVAAPRVTRIVPGREIGLEPQAVHAGEREAVAPARSSEAPIGGAPAPAATVEARATAEVAESGRPQPVRDPVDQIATRLREIKTPGRHEISLRLDPPDLGAVQIDARLEGARLHLTIRAEHAPTGELLTDALPRLRETLSQQGFLPTDVSVHLGLDASGRESTPDGARTFTPPPDGEAAPSAPVVRAAPARAVVSTDGLDVWA